MSRFFVEQKGGRGDVIKLSGEDAHHIGRVLRLRTGERLTIVCNMQPWHGQIEKILPGQVWVRLLDEAVDLEPPFRIFLLQGLPKGDKFSLVIQKSVELGVSDIMPLSCHHCDVHIAADKVEEKRKRWQKISAAAAGQCGRSIVPRVWPVQSLTQALAALPVDCLLLLAWEQEQTKLCRDVLRGLKPSNVAVLVGPEGGWEDGEVREALAGGAISVSLGKRILRTETAPLFLLSTLIYEWEDAPAACVDK